ncbi:MAG: TonB family protein [Cellvibrionaceae bacterium]
MCFRVNRVLLSSLTALGMSLAAPLLWADSLLNGLAIHKELNKEQFIGALYSDTLSNDASGLMASTGAKRMELKVVAKRLSARRLNSMWIEGMAINNPTSLLSDQAQSMVAFTALVKRSLRAGDVLSIRGSGDITTVTLNDIELGKIESEQFFDMVMRTWIGSVPLSSDFRDAILTNGSVDTELLARYEAIAPTQARRETIAKWLTPATPAAQVAQVKPAAPKPVIAAAPEKPSIAAPVIQQPIIAAAPAIESAPEPAAAVPAEPEPVEAPAEVAAVANEDELLDEELLDEEDYEEDVPVLTAESLLNRQLYHSQLLKWTYKYIRYPKRAVSRGHEGSVRVAVVIDRQGNIKNVSEVESSKYSTLNKEALGAVNRAVPFPAIPDGIEGDEFAFSLPIVFRLPK